MEIISMIITTDVIDNGNRTEDYSLIDYVFYDLN